MTSRLSKFKAKTSSAATPSFRFNTAEEDLEELTPVAPLVTSISREISAPSLSVSDKDAGPCDATNSNDPSKELNSNTNPVQQEIVFEEGQIQVKQNESLISEAISLPKPPLDGRSVKDISLIKRSVLDYSKQGKRSYSLDSGHNSDTDIWTAHKYKTHSFRTSNEKKNHPLGSSIDSNSGRYPYDQNLKFSGESKITNSQSLHSSPTEPRYIASTDHEINNSSTTKKVPIDKESHPDKDLSFNDFEDYSSIKWTIPSSLPSNNQPLQSSTSLTSSHPLLSPKRGKSYRTNVSMTLSALMASKLQENDICEEEETNVVEITKRTEIKSTDQSINKQLGDQIVKENFSLSTLYATAVLGLINMLKSWLRNINIRYHSSWKHSLFSIFVIFFSLLFAPLSPYVSGMLMGSFLSVLICWWWWLLFRPRSQYIPVIPDSSNLPHIKTNSSQVDDQEIYKGWMNELIGEYNPDSYHISNTHSVCVRLDGTSLRFSYPKVNIPKRAMWNESRPEEVFVDQKHCDISSATVSLLPVGLARKRLWSKKYPICLIIPNSKGKLNSFSEDSLKDLIRDDSSSSFTSAASKSSSKESSPVRKTFPKQQQQDEHGNTIIYLFSRTDRDKDEWFRRFKRASEVKLLKLASPGSSPSLILQEGILTEQKRAISVDLGSIRMSSSLGNIPEEGKKKNSDSLQEQFVHFMSSFLKRDSTTHFITAAGNPVFLREKKTESTESCAGNHQTYNVLWLNAFLGRLFFDFLTADIWAKTVSEIIQRKLSKIRLPYFVEELTITDINLGKSTPLIHKVSDPVMDDRGFWFDLDISYKGSFQMTLETKLNLLKLKKDQEMTPLYSFSERNKETVKTPRTDVCDSEEEDSAESSSDDDVGLPDLGEHGGEEIPSTVASGGSSTSKKFLRIVDKITQSRYFQQATEYKYIKKAMKEVSNTPLVLTVEVQWLSGTVALNVPPLPTDRLWYGFRTNPQLSILARPKLGGHVVTITHVIEWIEKKLILEFQKIFVMPNMDNIVIPIMSSNLLTEEPS